MSSAAFTDLNHLEYFFHNWQYFTYMLSHGQTHISYIHTTPTSPLASPELQYWSPDTGCRSRASNVAPACSLRRCSPPPPLPLLSALYCVCVSVVCRIESQPGFQLSACSLTVCVCVVIIIHSAPSSEWPDSLRLKQEGSTIHSSPSPLTPAWFSPDRGRHRPNNHYYLSHTSTSTLRSHFRNP